MTVQERIDAIKVLSSLITPTGPLSIQPLSVTATAAVENKILELIKGL